MPLSVQVGKHQGHADQVFVYVHLMALALGGGVAEQVTENPVQAVARVRLDHPLAVVSVQDD